MKDCPVCGGPHSEMFALDVREMHYCWADCGKLIPLDSTEVFTLTDQNGPIGRVCETCYRAAKEDHAITEQSQP